MNIIVRNIKWIMLFADGYPQIKIRILPKLSILPNDRSSMK